MVEACSAPREVNHSRNKLKDRETKSDAQHQIEKRGERKSAVVGSIPCEKQQVWASDEDDDDEEEEYGKDSAHRNEYLLYKWGQFRRFKAVESASISSYLSTPSSPFVMKTRSKLFRFHFLPSFFFTAKISTLFIKFKLGQINNTSNRKFKYK